MRAYAAVWLFCLALAGGTLRYSRKIAGDQSENRSVHLGLQKLIPQLKRGQQLYMITDANEGTRLIHARLELAPRNLFLGKAADTPDTLLTIAIGTPASVTQQHYRELAATHMGYLDFKLFVPRQ